MRPLGATRYIKAGPGCAGGSNRKKVKPKATAAVLRLSPGRGQFDRSGGSFLHVPEALIDTTGNGSAASSEADVVRRFLLLLEDGHLDAAMELLADDVEYINASLPTIRGRERTRRALSMVFGRPNAGFEVYFHAIASEGQTVLTERTDVLIFGRVRVQLWVVGRFDVVDGKIVRWKDYFDWLNSTVALLRGLLGAVIPALRPKPPST